MSAQKETGREYFQGTQRQQQRSYSSAVKARGGATIYLAGHGGLEDESGRSFPGDFDAQVRVSFERMRRTLERAGGTLEDIVTMTVFIVNMENGTRFTQIRKDFLRRIVIPPVP